jgi:acyl-coenzyme A thioesterase PaaI-like protein
VSDTPPTLDGTLEAVLGFELEDPGSELARARFEVATRHKQPYGLVHGGVYAALAESVASVATAKAVMGEGNIAMQATPRQDDLGLGRRHDRRRGPPVRDVAGDYCGAASPR